jgi:hypothetical protein
MSAALAFLGTFLLSLFVALLAALQLADYFGAGEEFALILLALPAFVLFSLIALIAAGLIVWRVWLFNWVAVLLGLVALAPVAWPVLMKYATGLPIALPGTTGRIIAALEFTVPALIAILAQWGLIRRRWLRAQGDDDLSLWPWFTTAVAGFAILNPVGLDILGETIAGRPPAMLRDVGRIWALGVGALIAMVLVEYYIRSWIRRRRQSRNPPSIEIGAAAG